MNLTISDGKCKVLRKSPGDEALAEGDHLRRYENIVKGEQNEEIF